MRKLNFIEWCALTFIVLYVVEITLALVRHQKIGEPGTVPMLFFIYTELSAIRRRMK